MLKNKLDTINTSQIQSPLLISLRDKLNLCINDIPLKELTLRQWKNDLIHKNHIQVIQAINEINSTDSVYIKKTLLPLLQDSLQKITIDSILSLIQEAYSSKLGKDSFPAKKLAVKERLQTLYNNKILDNKLIFGLGIALNNNPAPQYTAGSFRVDIKKWMYTGDAIHESFWNTVTGSESKETIKGNTAKETVKTLTDAE